MKNIDITIIIPYFNTAEELDKLLYSIGQHDNIEVIVIDDRSDKNIKEYNEIVKKYSKFCFKFLVNTSLNKGAGAARNIGLEQARGKWLLFADADDYFIDDWYEKISEYLNSFYDIVFFIPKGSFRAKKFEKYCNNYIDNQKNADLYIRCNFEVPWSKLIKHDLIEKNNIKFDEVLFANDVMFSVKAGIFANKIKVTTSSFYCVTECNKHSLTNTININSLLCRLEVICNKLNFLYKQLGYHLYLPDTMKLLNNLLFKQHNTKMYIKCFKLFRKAGIPFVYLIPFNKYIIRKYLTKLKNKINKFIKQENNQ